MRESGKDRRRGIRQFIQFGSIGVLNTGIDIAAFAVLIWFGVHYAPAQAAAYLAGMANSYALNTLVTFRDESMSEGATLKRPLRFAAWNLVMLGLSIALLALLTAVIGLTELGAKAIVTVVIVGLNFYGTKRWVYAYRRTPEMGGEA